MDSAVPEWLSIDITDMGRLLLFRQSVRGAAMRELGEMLPEPQMKQSMVAAIHHFYRWRKAHGKANIGKWVAFSDNNPEPLAIGDDSLAVITAARKLCEQPPLFTKVEEDVSFSGW